MINRSISHPAFYFAIAVAIAAIGFWLWGCSGLVYGMLFGLGIALWRVFVALREV